MLRGLVGIKASHTQRPDHDRQSRAHSITRRCLAFTGQRLDRVYCERLQLRLTTGHRRSRDRLKTPADRPTSVVAVRRPHKRIFKSFYRVTTIHAVYAGAESYQSINQSKRIYIAPAVRV